MKQITLKIGGMSCSACSNGLEKHLKKQNGILNASVNLVLQNAYIEYEDHITIDDLSKYIKKAGFENQGIYKFKEDQKSQKKKILLLIYGFLSIIYLYISMGHMLKLPIPNILNMDLNPKIFGITLLVLTIPYLTLGFNIFKKGIKNIFFLNPNMDTLVTIGVFSSFIYSTVNLILLLLNIQTYAKNLYFESSAIVIYFVTLGRYIDSNAKSKTMDAIKDLVQITPNDVLLKKDNELKTVTIDLVKPGDILVAKTGMKIGVDGKVVNGSCYVDQAFITGESKPVKKENSASVIAGSIVTNGYIEYSAEKIGKDSTISEVVRMVVDASNSKTKIARIADTICLYFVPTIIAIAIISFIGQLLFNTFDTAMNSFVSVLVVACPCALGLATPLAIVVSQGKLAKFGILIKKSEILENAHKIDTIVFDKTGTLTYGTLKISKIFNYKQDQDLLSKVCSLEKLSSHPIQTAFLDYQKNNTTNEYLVHNFQEIPGIGLHGQISNDDIYLGNNKLFNLLSINNQHLSDEETLLNDANSIIYVIINKEVVGLIGVKDIIRNNTPEFIQKLQCKNIECIMLTGDNAKVATIVSKELQINKVISDVLPKDKVEVIRSLINDGKHVMMVGDGINDAPALALATIGVSFNSATDIAGNASDVILMNDELFRIIDLISISKKTMRNIIQNLFWAFFYNVLMIPIAIGLFIPFGISMSPMIAGLGMTLSSLFVVFNALRLKRIKKENENV